MKRFTKSAFAAAVCLLAAAFAGCASPPLEEYGITNDEIAFSSGEEFPLELKDYSSTELFRQKVLVLDTENTKRTIRNLTAGIEFAYKVHNSGVAEDANVERLLAAQNASLKKSFMNVFYEPKEGEKYDLVLFRDFTIVNGARSGDKSVITLAYWFVYPVTHETDSRVGTTYVFRGKIEESGAGVIPYPANSMGYSTANAQACANMSSSLSGGLELYTSTDGEHEKTLITAPLLESISGYIATEMTSD